jgi:hypothetical protein
MRKPELVFKLNHEKYTQKMRRLNHEMPGAGYPLLET